MSRLVALSLMLFLASASSVLACLHGPQSYKGSLAQQAQEAILFWNKGRQELVVRLRYELSDGDSVGSLAWVVPVPTVPDAYGTVSPTVFEAIHTAWEQDKAVRRDATGRVVWKKPAEAGGGFSFSEEDGGVDVELLGQVSVGPYDIQPIRATGAKGATALNTWLAKNGFGKVPPANMRHYVERGWVWLAVKINPVRAGKSMEKEGTLRPLRISFASKRIVFPLKFSTHQGEFEVRLWVVTDGALSDDDRDLQARYSFTDEYLGFEQRWLPLPEAVDAIQAIQTGAKRFTPLDNRVGVKVPRVTRVSFTAKGSQLTLWREDFSLAPPRPAPKSTAVAPFSPRGPEAASRLRAARWRSDQWGAGPALLALDEVPASALRVHDLIRRATICLSLGDVSAGVALLKKARQRDPSVRLLVAQLQAQALLAAGQAREAAALIAGEPAARGRLPYERVAILTSLGKYAEAHKVQDSTRGYVVRRGKRVRRHRVRWIQTILHTLSQDEQAGIDELVRVAKALKRSDRREAMRVLGLLGPRVRAHLPVLLQALKSKREFGRREAARALVSVAPQDPRVFEALWRAFAARVGDEREVDDASWGTGAALIPLLARYPAKALKRLSGSWAQTPTLLVARALSQLGSPSAPLFRSALQGSSAEAAGVTLAALCLRPSASAGLVPELAAALERSTVGAHRIQAAVVLGRIGAAVAPAIPALTRALRKSDPELRFRASIALARAGREAIPALVELLGQPKTALIAARTLGRVGAPAVPALQAALKTGADRGLVVWALGQAGPSALPALIAVAKSPDARARATALCALSDLGAAAAPAAPVALTVLSGPANDLRDHAGAVLAALPKTAPALVKALGDRRGSVRAAAAVALARQALPEEEAPLEARVRRLLDLLRDVEPRVRRAGVEALSTESLDLFSRGLLPMIRSAKGATRLAALELLAAQGQSDLTGERFQQVVSALRDKDAAIRRAALRAISTHETETEERVQALTPLLSKDPDAKVRYEALWALTHEGRDLTGAGDALANAITDKAPGVRRLAARFIGSSDHSAPGTVLLAALSDADPRVRRAAALGLSSCDDEFGELIVPGLLKLLALGKQPDLQLAALVGLGSFSVDAVAKAAVVRSVESPSVAVQRRALDLLSDQLDSGDGEHARVMIGALAGSDAEARVLVVRCLTRLGDKVEGVRAALESARMDDDWRVRRAAKRALKRLKR